MRNLLVSATALEIEPVLTEWKHRVSGDHEPVFLSGKETDVLITGVGAPAMNYHLSKGLNFRNYDHAYLVGIAGGSDQAIELGETVEVAENCFYDLGAENSEEYLDVFDLNLLNKNQYPFRKKKLTNPNAGIWDLKQMEGISKNTVTGSKKRQTD